MATISGTVFRYDSAERIVNASVRATDKDGKIQQTLSDDDGEFSLSNLNTGTWSVQALHDECFPNQPIVMDIMTDKDKVNIKLQRLAGESDQTAGLLFFKWLLAGLGSLLVVYIFLHLIFPLWPAETPLHFVPWDKDPWRFLEIMLWGLGGILVNKIVTCGWYLRSQKFYREGIIMHIAHLAAAPLLVLVAVLLLSLVSLKVTLTGGSEVTIDLTELPILMAVSFLLGSSPWPLWNLIEKSAKGITRDRAEK
jgi:hypothetical protein